MFVRKMLFHLADYIINTGMSKVFILKTEVSGRKIVQKYLQDKIFHRNSTARPLAETNMELFIISAALHFIKFLKGIAYMKKWKNRTSTA